RRRLPIRGAAHGHQHWRGVHGRHQARRRRRPAVDLHRERLDDERRGALRRVRAGRRHRGRPGHRRADPAALRAREPRRADAQERLAADPHLSRHPARGVREDRLTAPVRVGICAWADPALIESRGFYPKKSMSAEARLRFYASVFDVVEVNASYYAIPDVLSVRRWAERTPPGFVFHVKAWALMTGHHPRAPALPAELQAALPARPRHTPRGEIVADDFPPEAPDAPF